MSRVIDFAARERPVAPRLPADAEEELRAIGRAAFSIVYPGDSQKGPRQPWSRSPAADEKR